MNEGTWLQLKTVLKSCMKDGKQFYIIVAEDAAHNEVFIPCHILTCFTDSVEKSLQRLHPVTLEDPIKTDEPSLQTEFDFTSQGVING